MRTLQKTFGWFLDNYLAIHQDICPQELAKSQQKCAYIVPLLCHYSEAYAGLVIDRNGIHATLPKINGFLVT
jgi:hypothetical protein